MGFLWTHSDQVDCNALAASNVKLLKPVGVSLLAISLSLCSVQAPASAQAVPLTGLQSAISDLQTPKAVAKFLRKNFKFRDDKKIFGVEDYWQTPEEFWGRKKGDCEDYALLSHHILKQQGIESYVVSIYGHRGYAHTVTIYKEDGKYNVINEDKHKRYKADTMEKAISKVYGAWTWGGIAEQRGSRGWMVRSLKNDSRKAARSTFRDNFRDFPF